MTTTGQGTVRQRVVALVAETLKVPEKEVKDSSHFADDLNADSLAEVQVIIAVEEEFDIEILQEEGEAFKTVGDVLKFLKEKGFTD